MLVWSLGSSIYLITGQEAKSEERYQKRVEQILIETKEKKSTSNHTNQSSSNIHSDLNSCESLKSRFQSCVNRSYRGLECFPGTDIVLPERCR